MNVFYFKYINMKRVRAFLRPCCLHLQGEVSAGISSNLASEPLYDGYMVHRINFTLKMEAAWSSESFCSTTTLYSVTFHSTWVFIALKTSSPAAVICRLPDAEIIKLYTGIDLMSKFRFQLRSIFYD